MKKIVKILCLMLLMSFFLVVNVDARENVKLYFFHGDGCPHCKAEEEFLQKIEKKYDTLDIVRYEVWYNETNQELLKKVQNKMNIDSNGVPVTIIGNTVITGYTESYDNKIERAINYYLENENEYQDVAGKIKNGTYNKKTKQLIHFH